MSVIAECGIWSAPPTAALWLRQNGPCPAACGRTSTFESASRRYAAVGSLLVIIVLSLAASGCGRSGEKPQRLPKTAITIAGRTLEVEVACTGGQRQTGMMHRRKLAPDEGMLFVFPDAEPLTFYMRNTRVALSIAFIGQDRRIINIAHMEPLTLALHNSRLPAMYALEMPLGWFEKNKVREGDIIGIPESAKATD